jgi:hypothetical protein
MLYSAYNKKGYSVIPEQDKMPLVKWGQYMEVLPDADIAGSWDFTYKKIGGYGLICGAVSGVIGIDFDTDDQELIAKIEAIIGKSPVRKRGTKGYTGFYQYTGIQSNKFNINGKCTLEILSDKRKTTIPPTKLASGTQYKWLDENLLDCDMLPALPKDVVKLLQPLFDQPKIYKAPKVKSFELNTTHDKAMQLLSYCNPDCNRDEWVNIGMAICNGFGDAGFYLFDTWSKGSSKYNPRDCYNTYNSFDVSGGVTVGTLYYYAELNGYGKEYKHIDIKSEINLEEFVAKPSYDLKAEQDYVFNNLPGVLADFYDFFFNSAIYEGRMLALGGTFGVLATALGGKVKLNGLSTALYLLICAETATGKDAARKGLQNLYKKAFCPNFVFTGKLGSLAGLEDRMAAHPKTLWMKDEAHELFNSMKNTQNNHLAQVEGAMLEFFSSEFGEIDLRAKAKGVDEPAFTKIINPSLTFYGTSTPAKLRESLGAADVANGMLNRCILLRDYRLDKTFVINKKVREDGSLLEANPPQKLVDVIKTINTMPSLTALEIPFNTSSKLKDLEVLDYQTALRNKYLDNPIRCDLYGRFHLQVRKLALISACAENINLLHRPGSFAITSKNIEFALKFVELSIQGMIKFIEDEATGGVNIREKVFNKIEKMFNNPNVWIYRSIISQRCKEVNEATINEILSTMIASGRIIASDGGNGAVKYQLNSSL